MSRDPRRSTDWFLTATERANPATTVCAWTEGNDVRVLVDGASTSRACSTTWRPADPAMASCSPTRGQRRRAARRSRHRGGRGVRRPRPPGRRRPRAPVALPSASARTPARATTWSWRGPSTRPAATSCSTTESAAAAAITRRSSWSRADRPDPAGTSRSSVGSTSPRAPRRRHAPRRRQVRSTLDDPHYGATPPWHDVQARLPGPAVADRRADVPGALGGPDPTRATARRGACCTACVRRARPTGPAPARRAARPDGDGPHAVQVLRTYPAKRPPYPFAPRGERSIARAYLKAFAARAVSRLPRGPVPVVEATPPTRSPTRCAANPTCAWS